MRPVSWVMLPASSLLTCCVFVLLVTVACDSTGVGNPPVAGSAPLAESEQLLLADGDDTRAAGDTSSAVTSLPLLSLASAQDTASAAAATEAAVRRATRWLRADCVTATAQATTVTYTFRACDRGPFDLPALEGTLVTTFASSAAGGVEANVRAVELTLGGSPISLTTTARVRFEGATRITTSQGAFAFRTAAGHQVASDSDVTFSYDYATGCLGLGGTATTTVDGRGLSAVWKDYTRCGPRTRCPQAGSSLALTRAAASPPVSLEITFLGGTAARITRPNGAVITENVTSCDP